MSFLRPFLVLAIVAAAIVTAIRHTEHHEGGIFQVLYMHLMPAPLVAASGHGGSEHGHGASAHAEPLVRLPLPASLSAFDMDHGGVDGPQLVMTNLQVFQIAAVLLILLIALPNIRKTREVAFQEEQ